MKKVLNISFYVMFGLYMTLVLDTVLLNRMGVNMRGINLIPFQGMIDFINGANFNLAKFNIGGNILMFIPMGIYLKSLFPEDSALKGMAKLTLISLVIEVCQFILAAGMTDIDDIILNVSGGVIGMLIVSILFKLFKHSDKVRVAVAALSLIIGIPVVGLIIFLYIYNGFWF